MVKLLVAAGLIVAALPSAAAAVVSRAPNDTATTPNGTVVQNGYKLFNLSLSIYDPVIMPLSSAGFQYDNSGRLGFSEILSGAKVLLFGTSVHWYGSAASKTKVTWGIDRSANPWSLTGPPANDDWGLSSSAVFDHDYTVANPVNPTLTTTPRGQFGYFIATWSVAETGQGVTGSASISNVTIETGLKTEADSFDRAPSQTLDVVNATGGKNAFFQITGNPEFRDTLGPSDTPPSSYPHLALTNQDQIDFDVPEKTSFMVIKGGVAPNGASYEVSVTPNTAPKDWSPNSATVPASWSLNSSCPMNHEATMFYMPLDPGQQYRVSVKTNGKDNGSLAFRSVTFYSSTLDIKKEPTASVATTGGDEQSAVPTGNNASGVPAGATAATKSGPGVGVIAGAAVGGVVAILAVVALVWFFTCHRRRYPKARPSALAISHEKEEPSSTTLTRFPEANLSQRQLSTPKPREESWRESRLSMSDPGIDSDNDTVHEEPFVFLSPRPDRTNTRKSTNAYRPPPVSLRPFWDPRLRLDRTHSATSSITEMHSVASSEAGDHGDRFWDASENGPASGGSGSYSSARPFFNRNDGALNSDGSQTAPLSASSSIPILHPSATGASSWYEDNHNRDTVQSAEWAYAHHLTAEPGELSPQVSERSESTPDRKRAFRSSTYKSTSSYIHDDQEGGNRMTVHLTTPEAPPPPGSPPPPTFAQERDAGLLVQVPMELIPPSYDPAWAERHASTRKSKAK